MANSVIPNDIIEEIINILALTKDKEPNSFHHIGKFSTVSSFCLHQARKHIFDVVKLGTPLYWPNHNRPQKLATLFEQLTFFSLHPHPLAYIRELQLRVSVDEMKDQVVQDLIYNTLLPLDSLTTLQIDIGYSHKQYTDPDDGFHLGGPPAKSVKSALRTLLHSSKTLSRLTLSRFPNVSLNDLTHASGLRHLELSSNRLIVGDPPHKSRRIIDGTTKPYNLAQLESITINGCDGAAGAPYFKELKDVLLARYDDGQLILQLSALKALAVEVSSISTFGEILELLEVQRITTLEDISLEIQMEGWFYDTGNANGTNDFSTWLNKIILPSQSTLRTLTVEISIAAANQDPFAGLCTTLKLMEPDNVLASLHIKVVVQTDCLCTTGDEWAQLGRAFERGERWKHLTKISLQVEVAAFRAPDEEMVESLKTLPETHLKSLLSNAFVFDYAFEVFFV